MSDPVELLANCYGDYEIYLDPREPIEHEISWTGQDLRAVLTRWREQVGPEPTEESVREAALTQNAWTPDPPEGNSWLRWGRWYEQRLVQAAAGGSGVLDREEVNSLNTPVDRVSAGVTPSTARRARAALLAEHAEEVTAWLAEGTGRRLHLVGDTGAVVGHACRVDPWAPGLSMTATDSIETTWAAVTLDRLAPGVPDVEVVAVSATEPDEHPWAARWRRGFPRLRDGLGGYLGPAAVRYWLWGNQEALLRSESRAWLDAFAAEGERFLGLNDVDLRAACRALGCYQEVTHLRLWLTWMFWRAREFDWS